MKTLKRNAVILSVLLFVCVAVYLNWTYNKKGEIEDGKSQTLAAETQDGEKQADGSSDKAEAGDAKDTAEGTENTAAENSGAEDGKTETDPEKDAAEDDSEKEDAGLYYMPDGTVSTMSEYFASVRLSRSQARDETVSTLAAITETEGAAQEAIDDAVAKMTRMAEYTAQEAELESLIMAKGFSDCVVFMSDEGIDVTVTAPEEGLSTASVARITDVVVNETDFTAENLKIIEVK